MPYFSVITSAYNAQDFILTALNSVKAQEEADYEYIVVDNGSNDNTLKLIACFIAENPQMNIRLVHFDVNQGISGGRNAGLEKALGQYVCFLDADDYWYANKLSSVKEAIENNKGYNVFCHWENHVENQSSVLGAYRDVDNRDAYRDLLFNGNCLSTSAMTIETTLIKESGGFSIKLVMGEEDYDCWLRLARNGARFYMIKKPLGVWLIRQDSISSKHIKHTYAVIDMLQPHYDCFLAYTENKLLAKKMRRRTKARNLCGCGRAVSLAGDRKTGSELYKKAIKADKTFLKAYAGLVLNMFCR